MVSGQQPRPDGSRLSDRPAFEAECYAGMVEYVAQELASVVGIRIVKKEPGGVLFAYERDWQRLDQLRLATAVYRVIPFDIPRPKALLGHRHFQRLVGEIQTAITRHPPSAFQTFRLSAAGQDSAVYRRLIEALSAALKLAYDPEAGDLFLRVRRSHTGWEVLVRLGNRPLTTRSWRVEDRPGALAGPLAALMIDLAHLERGVPLFNLLCGSGTLLVEAGLVALSPELHLGGDRDPVALAASAKNIAAAGISASLVQLEGEELPLGTRSTPIVVCDLPWGHLVGSHLANERLYPALLAEVARIVPSGGRFVLITHETRLLDRVLGQVAGFWRCNLQVKLKIGQLRPRIYRLLRR